MLSELIIFEGIVSPVSPPNTGLFTSLIRDIKMGKQKRFSKDQKIKISPFKDYWNKYNFYLLYLSVGILVLGYYLMSIGMWNNFISLSISPIVLLIAYIVLIPITILFKNRISKKEENAPSES